MGAWGQIRVSIWCKRLRVYLASRGPACGLFLSLRDHTHAHKYLGSIGSCRYRLPRCAAPGVFDRVGILEDVEDSDSLAPVPAPPPRRRRSSSASLFGDEDPISSLRGRSAVPRSPRRRSASGSSFVDVGPGHKTRAPRSAARTPRRRGTTPTIDDYYAKYSRSTAERLYEHDNATRRTFDEAARHAEALFAAHDMSPARD